MTLSVVIPAHNEEGAIDQTVRGLHAHLTSERIEHDILVINDHSKDATESILRRVCGETLQIRYLNNPYSPGFGLAVRYGLENFRGDAVAVYMADASDRPEDLVLFFRTLVSERVDCVFGSRFIPGGKLIDYPKLKLVLNRCANTFIRLLFGFRYNDITNAFKLYRGDVIKGLKPFLSHHFNITVELPLKAIVRGYRYAVVPNHWINRTTGKSKAKIKEMGSRYLFIVLYCFIEKWLSRGDYHQSNPANAPAAESKRVT
ncbi:MAG: glycosyltransferase family 2 protein [Acidobacteria bacterium]|nr:glycosyltransferase family 2 protein [Acidobacteriota bacterium]